MLPCACCHPLTLISATGLRSGVFRDIPFIQEVECSGAGLDSDTNLLSASLYRLSDNAILASLNMGTKECTTSSSFSSCEIRDTDSRKSRVRTLVMNLSSGESLRFGCEVSSIRAGERVKVNSWFLTLTGASSEYTQFSPRVSFVDCRNSSVTRSQWLCLFLLHFLILFSFSLFKICFSFIPSIVLLSDACFCFLCFHLLVLFFLSLIFITSVVCVAVVIIVRREIRNDTWTQLSSRLVYWCYHHTVQQSIYIIFLLPCFFLWHPSMKKQPWKITQTVRLCRWWSPPDIFWLKNNFVMLEHSGCLGDSLPFVFCFFFCPFSCLHTLNILSCRLTFLCTCDWLYLSALSAPEKELSWRSVVVGWREGNGKRDGGRWIECILGQRKPESRWSSLNMGMFFNVPKTVWRSEKRKERERKCICQPAMATRVCVCVLAYIYIAYSV